MATACAAAFMFEMGLGEALLNFHPGLLIPGI
jgi:hypothetical protein